MPASIATLRAIARLAGLAAPIAIGHAAEPPRLQAFPAAIRLDGASDRAQISVSIASGDGTTRDVSSSARLTISPPDVASASGSGLITPRADGRAEIRVEADGLATTIPVEVRRAGVERAPSYRLDVLPLLSRAGCNAGACHGNIHGKGGFRLSLRGDDPEFDLLAMTRDGFGRRADLIDPARSLLVRKPTGQDPHEGGVRFAPGSPEAAALLGWIGRGARDDREDAPRLVRLDVEPSARILPFPSLRQQLVVLATFSDGSRRDVTHQASFDVNDPAQVAVGPDGVVEARRPIEATVAVRFLDGRGVSRLAFLPDRQTPSEFGPEPTNPVDVAVFAKLRAHKIRPSEPAGDATFLRRASLDLLGILPTADEARAFLADADPDKRVKLVDRLLARPEFADFWALKWADLLRNEDRTMGPKGLWTFQRWLRDQIAADVPLDTFARSLVSTTGSTLGKPPASFHRTNRDPMAAAETFGQVFLGVRLQCARCHNHPHDRWTQDDYYGLAAYFGNVKRKQINNFRRDENDKHEINGNEIVYLSGRPEIAHPRTGRMLPPKPPGGERPDLVDDDGLSALADWLAEDNPQFARNMANRAWFHLMGRGIVDPVDDFRESNPPSNPALLDLLAERFRADGYRLKPLIALIMTSRTYALDARPNDSNADDEANFSHATVRILPAEVLLDAIGRVLERPEVFAGLPPGTRAVQRPGVKAEGPFLKVFGKPDRLLACECERSESTTLAQAFQLINGDAVRVKLAAEDNRIGRLIGSGATDAAILDELTLAALGHGPDATRQAALLDHVARAPDRRKGWEDVAWAILNSKEFLLRH
ncbi:DUF1549 domain-containing protein [Tundrisphaera sp. TA3]|uniref:DUF1549 domain-containing protein n=1 Tax=Tundrisphaera sp. TA3 TaxID=3435775 RepID=UPI003EC083F4